MYVAAFFPSREANSAEKRSIFVYCENPHNVKGGAVGEPAMHAVGKYVRNDLLYRFHQGKPKCG
jgi:hypothetical protein